MPAVSEGSHLPANFQESSFHSFSHCINIQKSILGNVSIIANQLHESCQDEGFCTTS